MTDRKQVDSHSVINTRPSHQASALTEKLREAGIRTIEFPAIEITEPDSWTPVDRALDELPSYDWLVFTSQNGVERFLDRARERNLPPDALQAPRTAAIGSATARILREHLGPVDLLPDEFRSEGLASALADHLDAGQAVLLPRSNVSRPVLVRTLTEEGIQVNEVHPYHLARPSDHASDVLEQLSTRSVDLVSFTSSMIVRNFDDLLVEYDLTHLRDTPAACIGPITRDTADQRGYDTPVVAEEYTMEGLVKAIREHLGIPESETT